jgi:hypothetical protein
MKSSLLTRPHMFWVFSWQQPQTGIQCVVDSFAQSRLQHMYEYSIIWPGPTCSGSFSSKPSAIRVQ